MADIELVIKMDEETVNKIKDNAMFAGTIPSEILWDITSAIVNGKPLEEISNPCIECSQNCCVCELNGEKCDCQKVYVVKENK